MGLKPQRLENEPMGPKPDAHDSIGVPKRQAVEESNLFSLEGLGHRRRDLHPLNAASILPIF
jgi:hypothetical protein